MAHGLTCKKDLSLTLFFIGLTFILVLAKDFSPLLVSFLYHQNYSVALNFLSGISLSTPLGSIDFYLGRVEEVALGPLSMALSAALFLFFSLKYLRSASIKKFGLAVFLYFLITKWEILFFPPFGDDITGPFAEAVWLFQNNFDYVGLAGQPTFVHGGAKVYLFSIYPSFLALGMKLIPNIKLFLLVSHLVALGLAAGVVTLFRFFLLKFFNQRISLLLAILLLSFPVFQAQAEAINMDMPALFFSMSAIYALSQQKFLRSAFLAIVAVTIKMYSIFIGLTVFAVCLLFFLAQRDDRRRFGILLCGCIPLAVSLIQALLLFFFLKADRNNYAVGLFLGRQWLVKSVALYLFSFSFVVFVVFLIKKIFTKARRNFLIILQKYDCVIACFLATFCWFVIFGQSYFFGVRYYLQMLPFFIVCMAWVAMIFLKSRRRIALFTIVLIFLANACSYGMNFKERAYDQGSVRSLEYRSGVRFQQKLVAEVEQRFSGLTLVAPILTAQALGIRELGYVQKPMDVKIYFWPSKYGGIGELKESDILLRDRMVWIELVQKGKPSLIDPLFDRVLKEVSYGNQKEIGRASCRERV